MIKKVGVAGAITAPVVVLGAVPAYAAANQGAVGAGNGNSWYDAIIEFAASTPSWFQNVGVLFTKTALLIYVAFFLLAWWHARRRGPGNERAVARAALTPLATGLAYLLSEVSKAFIHEDRPCRGLASAATVLECPENGDWSLPSNHATIAAASAMGLAFASRKLAPWVVGIALLMAFSRVFVGVHYPHDVLIGLLLGAVVAAATVRFATEPMSRLVARFDDHQLLGTARTTESSSVPPPQAPAQDPMTRPMRPNPAQDQTEQLPRTRHAQPGRNESPNAQEPARPTPPSPQDRPVNPGYGDSRGRPAPQTRPARPPEQRRTQRPVQPHPHWQSRGSDQGRYR